MPKTKQPIITKLVRELQDFELSPVKLTTKPGLSNESVNRWENRRTKPLPISLKQIEQLLHPIGIRSKVLLAKSFAE